MAAAQHGSSTTHGTNIIGHRQQNKGQEGRDNTTSREAATQLSGRVSLIESLNEEMEIKHSTLSVFCSSFQSLAAVERPRDVCALGTFNKM
jgi:hypothetical protein